MSAQTVSYYTTSSENSLTATKQPVRFFTQYYINQFSLDPGSLHRISIPLKSQPIFQTYVYTESNVYLAKVYQANLNRQLKWSEKSFDLLKSCLSGQNKSIIVQLDIASLKLSIFTQFNQSSIRILLFEANLICLHKDPIKHAHSMLNITSLKYKERLNQLKYERKIRQQNIDKIEALCKQVTQQHEFEMNMAKDKFLIVINQVKKRLRPHFGIEEKREEDENQDSQTRTLYRIKQTRSYNKEQSQNLLNLFD